MRYLFKIIFNIFFLDFSKLYSDKAFIQSEKWNLIRDCLVKHLYTISINSVEEAAFQYILKSTDLVEGIFSYYLNLV